MIHGHAVFCLHEPNPLWFQGYFLPHQSSRPWGLLAIQEPVDDCLACADGGFRRITLKLYPPSGSSLQPLQPKKKKPKKNQNAVENTKKELLQLENVDWTGGDMIQLRHEQLEMEADRLWTGTATLPHLQRYFASLLTKLKMELDVPESTPILDFLPDVAVIVGKLSFVPTMDESDVDS